MNDASIEPVTITIPAALRATGLGRTKLYELIAKREIASVRVGTRRLINYASLKAFLNAKGA
jgi:excisionase family DNA binding protein